MNHLISLLSLSLLFASSSSAIVNESNRPNIIFMMADDMGLGDVQAYDKTSTIPTPHMNKLADEGIRFVDAHSPASVCTPTRYSVLTGRFPFRSKLSGGVLRSAYDTPLLEKRHETVAGLLKRAGYHTAAFGKWHLGMTWQSADKNRPAKAGVGTSIFSTRDVDFDNDIIDGPRQHGFDYFFGLGSSINHGPYTFIENTHVTEKPDRFRNQKNILGQSYREGWIAPSWDDSQQDVVVAQKALAFISDHIKTNAQQPFFMYYAALANHWPHCPPTENAGHAIKGQGGQDDESPERNDKVYEFDVVLGLLLNRLKDPNQDGDHSDSVANNTLIIVTSDNGADVGYYTAIRGKKTDLYEGGHRIPFIAHWPEKIPKGVVSNKRISLIDLYTTLAQITGTSKASEAAQDSFNIVPALLGEANERWTRGPLLQQQSGGTNNFAVLKGPWKLLIKKNRATELYNLEEDLKETTDLSNKQPEIVKDLMNTYQNLRK